MSGAMSERGLEEIEEWYKLTEHYSMHGQRHILQTYGLDRLLREVRRSHAEAAELRKKIRNIETLEEELAIRVREFLDAERQVVEGWNENAELRKRVRGLEEALRHFEDDWSLMGFEEYDDMWVWDGDENPMDIVEAALSQANAQAKPEARSEEEA